MSALPLVCLHGWGLNGRVFDDLQRRWPGPVLAPDLPGHGAAPWTGEAHSLEDWTRLLAVQLPPQCALLGWSLGGQLALRLAAQAPQQVRRLVLVATTPRFVAGPGWEAGLAPALLQRFAEGLSADWQATLAEFLQLQVRGSRDAAQVLAGLQQAVLAQGAAQPRALAAGLALLRDTDLRAAVATVVAPALVVSGQHDRVTPPQAGAWLATALPQARHRLVPRAGHAPFLSHPDEFCAHLADFLQEAA